MNDINLIDPQVVQDLLDSTGGDSQFIGELIDTYFQDTPQLLADMRTALQAGNAPNFRRAAHSLKSTSANFGARRLAAICKEMEDQGKAGVFDGAVEKLALAEATFASVKAALDRKRSEMMR